MNLEAARAALNKYNKVREFTDTVETDVIDLITELLHVANESNCQVERILRMVEAHITEEINQ